MSKIAGIWIDHREAVLVSIENNATSVCLVESEVGQHFHPSGGWKAGGTSVAQSIVKEQTADERRKHGLHAFYQKVIKKVAGKTDEIYIFGPGSAKHELIKEVEKLKGPHITISAVETCDRMTLPQITAKVRSFFEVLGRARA